MGLVEVYGKRLRQVFALPLFPGENPPGKTQEREPEETKRRQALVLACHKC